MASQRYRLWTEPGAAVLCAPGDVPDAEAGEFFSNLLLVEILDGRDVVIDLEAATRVGTRIFAGLVELGERLRREGRRLAVVMNASTRPAFQESAFLLASSAVEALAALAAADAQRRAGLSVA